MLLAAILVSGCNKAPEVVPVTTPQEDVPIETQVEVPIETPVETPVEVPTVARYGTVPAGLSPMTGLPYEGDGKVVMVQVENTEAARPHSGLASADLIYEIEVEGKITRLTAFFLSSYPEKVGPVRSARRQHMYLWSEWKYVYAFFGGSSVRPANHIYDLMEELKINTPYIDGMRIGKSFSRSSDRPAPHNAYTNTKYIVENLYDFDPVDRSLYFDESVLIEGAPARNISFSYNSGNKVSYAYNNENEQYRRAINGKAMMDKESGKQIEVTNIIIQHANHYAVKGTVYTNIDLVGKGTAEYYTDGIARVGTWERKDVASYTIFYDDKGEEIAFKPGKTFIQIVRNDTAVQVD